MNLRQTWLCIAAGSVFLIPHLTFSADDKEKVKSPDKPERLVEDEEAEENVKRPVAVPKITPQVAAAAQRLAKNPMNGVIILDGTRSKPVNANLTYQWKQVAGEDLKLPEATLARDRLGIRIYKVGTYKFQLAVSDGKNTSKPVEVELKVVDPDDK